MRKNLGISPKETAADQSWVRRLSPADRRYIFSIRVPRSKGDEQICSPLCLTSPFRGWRWWWWWWEEVSEQTAGSPASRRTPRGNAAIVSANKQLRINEMRSSVLSKPSRGLFVFCLVFFVLFFSEKRAVQPSQWEQFKAKQQNMNNMLQMWQRGLSKKTQTQFI